jgi:hypothetical protein
MKLKNASDAKGGVSSSQCFQIRSPIYPNQRVHRQSNAAKTGSWIHLCAYGVLLCIVVSVLADQKVQPPDPRSIVGAWFGYDENRLNFCRLEFNADSKGFFAITFVDDPAELYRVEKWSLRDFDIKLDPTPVDQKAEPIYLKGTATLNQLTLELGGKRIQWHRKLILFNTRMFLSKNRRVEDRIEKYKQEANKD